MRAIRLLMLVGSLALLPASASAGWGGRAWVPGPPPAGPPAAGPPPLEPPPGPPPLEPPRVDIVPRYHFGPGPDTFPPIVPEYHFGAEPGPYYTGAPPGGPQAVWVPGYWDMRGSNWAWIEGAWVAPPEPNCFWVPPHWAPVANRWYWEQGHWAAPGTE